MKEKRYGFGRLSIIFVFALTSHFHLNVGLSVGDPLEAAHQLLSFQQIIIDRVWQMQAPMILIIALLNRAAV